MIPLSSLKAYKLFFLEHSLTSKSDQTLPVCFLTYYLPPLETGMLGHLAVVQNLSYPAIPQGLAISAANELQSLWTSFHQLKRKQREAGCSSISLPIWDFSSLIPGLLCPDPLPTTSLLYTETLKGLSFSQAPR